MRTDISLVFDTTLVTKPRSITAHFPTLSVSATGTQHFIFHLFCADSRLCSSLTWENKMQNWEGFFCFSESENLIFVALVIVWRILRQQPVSPSPHLHPHPQLKPNGPICCFAAFRNIWRNLPAVQRGSRFMTHTYPSSWKSPIWTHTHTHIHRVTHAHTSYTFTHHLQTHLHTHTP